MKDRPSIVIATPRVVGTFVRQDERLLGSTFEVTLVRVSGPASLISLNAAIGRADAVLLWFLGRHAIPTIAFAVARSVPIVAVIGGFEVAWESDIGYGVRPDSARESLLHWMLRRTRAIVTVSQYSYDIAAARFPNLTDRMVLIHNAVDSSSFNFSPGSPRSGVLCVASLSRDSIAVKNLHLFRQLAEAMPDQAFTLVGPAMDATARQFVLTLPRNLRWTGHLSGDALLSVYQQASIYVQLSRHESFSLALAEAMSCGCLPVTSANGALPEVGGLESRVVNPLSVASCQAAIRSRMDATDEVRLRVREHIVTRFGTQRRSDMLSQLIGSVVKPHRLN